MLGRPRYGAATAGARPSMRICAPNSVHNLAHRRAECPQVAVLDRHGTAPTHQTPGVHARQPLPPALLRLAVHQDGVVSDRAGRVGRDDAATCIARCLDEGCSPGHVRGVYGIRSAVARSTGSPGRGACSAARAPGSAAWPPPACSGSATRRRTSSTWSSRPVVGSRATTRAGIRPRAARRARPGTGRGRRRGSTSRTRCSTCATQGDRGGGGGLGGGRGAAEASRRRAGSGAGWTSRGPAAAPAPGPRACSPTSAPGARVAARDRVPARRRAGARAPAGDRQPAAAARPTSPTSTTTRTRSWSSWTAARVTRARAGSATCGATTPTCCSGRLTLRYGHATCSTQPLRGRPARSRDLLIRCGWGGLPDAAAARCARRARQLSRALCTEVGAQVHTIVEGQPCRRRQRRSRDIGSSCGRTPMASVTALARAGATGLYGRLAHRLRAVGAELVGGVGEVDLGVGHVGHLGDVVVPQDGGGHAARPRGPAPRTAPCRSPGRRRPRPGRGTAAGFITKPASAACTDCRITTSPVGGVDRDAEALDVERERADGAVAAALGGELAGRRRPARRTAAASVRAAGRRARAPSPRGRSARRRDRGRAQLAPAGRSPPRAPRGRRRPSRSSRTRRCRARSRRCRSAGPSPAPPSVPSALATSWVCTVVVPLPNSAVPTRSVYAPSASTRQVRHRLVPARRDGRDHRHADALPDPPGRPGRAPRPRCRGPAPPRRGRGTGRARTSRSAGRRPRRG